MMVATRRRQSECQQRSCPEPRDQVHDRTVRARDRGDRPAGHEDRDAPPDRGQLGAGKFSFPVKRIEHPQHLAGLE